jgi:HK97 family phage major capsid protein
MEFAQEIADRVRAIGTEVKSASENLRTSQSELSARVLELEQKSVGDRRGGGDYRPETWGSTVVGSDEFKSYVRNGGRGICRLEVKTVTSAANSAGAMVNPDRDPEVATLARRVPRVRSLLAQDETTSNAVEVSRETVYTNNAAVVPEGALKPQSDIAYELTTVPVKTIAHWLPVSRQVMDDAPQLRGLIDGALRWGLSYVEELQLLLGSGVGDDIHGLMPQATPFVAPFEIVGATPADIILQAIAQAQQAELPATGVVLNTLDWSMMTALKATDGSYLGGGPFGVQQPRMWGLPVVPTNAMPAGSFLVGNFSQAAKIYDRMSAEVLISQDHADFFVKNMLAVRAESRLAMAVIRPQALVKGTFPA